MAIQFTKYHGTGNDFILVDDRNEAFDIENHSFIESLCSRRFGIGADGLILLRNIKEYDFEMVYFNSDGRQSSMCGNGGRCIVHFAKGLGLFKNKCTFLAIDGEHQAEISKDIVKLKMGDVTDIIMDGGAFVLDTGSPHYVEVVESILDMNIKEYGAKVRYSPSYKKEGINVNLVKPGKSSLEVATYERGVEDETYSCGTGVTAVALAMFEYSEGEYSSPIDLNTKGGALRVYFKKNGKGYEDIWLEGPATIVFEGEI